MMKCLRFVCVLMGIFTLIFNVSAQSALWKDTRNYDNNYYRVEIPTPWMEKAEEDVTPKPTNRFFLVLGKDSSVYINEKPLSVSLFIQRYDDSTMTFEVLEAREKYIYSKHPALNNGFESGILSSDMPYVFRRAISQNSFSEKGDQSIRFVFVVNEPDENRFHEVIVAFSLNLKDESLFR